MPSRYIRIAYKARDPRALRARALYKRYVQYLGMIYVICVTRYCYNYIDLCGLPKITDFCCNYFEVLQLYNCPLVRILYDNTPSILLLPAQLHAPWPTVTSSALQQTEALYARNKAYLRP